MTDHNAMIGVGMIKGLWSYLITRSDNRTGLERERERNRAYAEHRDRLPGNSELADYEDEHGRVFWIRTTTPDGQTAQLVTVAIEQESLGELDGHSR